MNRNVFPSPRASRVFLLCTAAIVGIFIIFGLWALNSPGLYMDAVNPDYEVVKTLDPTAPVSIWQVPGNMLFSRFPILFGLYGGSYAVYWAAPFYLLLGGSVASIRIAHLCWAIVFLCLFAFMARRLTKLPSISLIVVLLLALDPVFIYCFRTQAYEVLFSAPLLFASIYAMYRFPSIRGYFAAGILVGLSGFGYFVNLLSLPGIILFAIRDRDVRSFRFKSLAALFVGVGVGISPYFLGYGLIFSAMGGFGPGADWVRGALVGLHVSGQADTSYVSHVASVASMFSELLTTDWLWRTIWAEPHSDIGQNAKTLVLLFLPLAALISKKRSTRVSRAFAAVVYPTYSFMICATYFGPRLGAHDLIALIPLTYLAAALAIPVFFQTLAEYRTLVTRAFIGIGGVLLVSNTIASANVATRLSKDGGAGMYSAIFSDLADRALLQKDSAPYIFWDWGEMMPFIYRTHGSIPAFSNDQLAASLCRYGTTNVVFSGDDALYTSPTFSLTGLTVVQSALLHDKTSSFPMRILTVRSIHPSAGCSAKSSPGGVSAPAQQQLTKQEPRLRMKTSSNRGVEFVSDPGSVPILVGGALPIITVHWKALSVTKIEIHMGSPSGALFASGGNDGSQATGAWMQPGVKFYLQDVDDGEPGKTIAVLTASVCEKCNR